MTEILQYVARELGIAIVWASHLVHSGSAKCNAMHICTSTAQISFKQDAVHVYMSVILDLA